MGELGNKAMGKTKKAVGRATGDRDLEGEGRIQETTGKVQGGVRKGARKVEDAIDRMGQGLGDRQRAKRTARQTGKPAPEMHRKATRAEGEAEAVEGH
jgi:uncharacterized protein YjbJ (UPF0337 family)